MKLLAVLSNLIAAVAATSINYKDCPASEGTTGHALEVMLSPCPSQPCTFHHGDTVNVQIKFTALEDTPTLMAKVYGIVLGVPVEFSLPNPDGCKNGTLTCPLFKAQTYTYSSSFKVLDSYPAITLVVMWKLEGNAENEVCFTFPMSISASGGANDGVIIG